MDMASRAPLPWARPRRLQQILIMEAMARRAILVVPTIKAADTGAVSNIPGMGYYSGGPYAAYGSYPVQDYATRNGFTCHPGTMVKLDDGQMYRCQ
jgi:hypothetical protein